MLRLISYLAPSIPAEFFALVARDVGEACGVGVDTALEFDTSISGPLPGDDDPFADARADIGFVCSPTYRWMRDRVALLPAPVPLDVRAAGRPAYFADVVVRKDSGVMRFDDLRGRRWAYNDRNSKSGWFSMLERAGGDPAFFSGLLHSGSHLQSLDAMVDGRADAAAIDSNVLFLRMPQEMRVLESWGPFAIQPVILRAAVSPSMRTRIANALLSIHERHDLAPFGFARFATVDTAAYT